MSSGRGKEKTYTFGEEFARPFFEGFQREVKELGATPHWGNHLDLICEEARKLYPAYDRFNDIRRGPEPKGTFASGFMRELFG